MVAAKISHVEITPESPEAFINRELSWLRFASRVLELAEDQEVSLLERVKFAGIHGMLHDEFFMKRIAGLKRQVKKGVEKISIDGRTPFEELEACRESSAKKERTVRSNRNALEPQPVGPSQRWYGFCATGGGHRGQPRCPVPKRRHYGERLPTDASSTGRARRE